MCDAELIVDHYEW